MLVMWPDYIFNSHFHQPPSLNIFHNIGIWMKKSPKNYNKTKQACLCSNTKTGHLLPQSYSKLKSIATWSPSFSRASWSLHVFISSLHYMPPRDIFLPLSVWLLRLLWFWLHNTQSKSALMWHTIRASFAHRTHLQRLILLEPRRTYVTYDPNVSQCLLHRWFFFKAWRWPVIGRCWVQILTWSQISLFPTLIWHL